jgi:tRNA threonylcarbamoyladenosine biosynthesis protein TsaE
MSTFLIPSVDKIGEVAKAFISAYPEPAVFCFYGSMGAGKTTFIQALCEQLHVVDVVNSPSFAIVNEYNTDKDDSVYHFDFYRLKEEEEAFDLGYEDYFYSGNYCFVEWPEKIDSLLPATRFDVKITVNEDQTRKVEVLEIKA